MFHPLQNQGFSILIDFHNTWVRVNNLLTIGVVAIVFIKLRKILYEMGEVTESSLH